MNTPGLDPNNEFIRSKPNKRIITFPVHTKILRPCLLQCRKGRESDAALKKVVVQHLPEVVFPRMYIIRNTEKLQNELSSRV
jgi:hypothetical protein